MKRPKLKVREYKHSKTGKLLFMLDLRAYNGKRQFYRTRVAAEDERLRFKGALERHGRRAALLLERWLPNCVAANSKRARKALQNHCRGIIRRSAGSETKRWTRASLYRRSKKTTLKILPRLWLAPNCQRDG